MKKLKHDYVQNCIDILLKEMIDVCNLVLTVGLPAQTLNSIAHFFNVLSLASRTRAIGYVLKNYCVIAPRQQK